MVNKTCKQCDGNFEVGDWDRKFLDRIAPTFSGVKFEIPDPKLCPDCRRQRRLIWRDHKYLYKRDCDLCGKATVSTYSKEKPFPVYCQDCWWSDKWDPLTYGKDFDFSRSFFDQFAELINQVPRLALMNKNPENSEFCNNAGRNKNCYLCNGGSWDNDSCVHGIRLDKCKDSVDNRLLTRGELCYKIIFGENLYKCTHSSNLFNSKECHFSVNLRGCDHCVFCSNLNNKTYFAYNKPCSKEEFDNILNQMKSYRGLKELEAKYNEFLKTTIFPPVTQISCENCSGDYLRDCKNATEAYDGFQLENVKYYLIGEDCRDAMDATSTGMEGTQLIYECMSTGVGAFNCLFNHGNWTARENLYSDTLMSCNNCFGSSNLKHQEYIVFNKKYSKIDYEILVSKIIKHMQDSGEWGEYFPMNLSVFCYNESIANEYYPLDKIGALELDAKWREFNDETQIFRDYYIPKDNIEEFDQSEIEKLSSGVIECEISRKPFKLNPIEISFFLKMKIAIPRKHYDVRYDELGQKINPKNLYHRKCMNEGCLNEFETSYAPERSERVFCEECYQKVLI